MSVKARGADGAMERLRGVLTAVDADGITIRTDDGERQIAFDAIEQARTVFEWAPAPKPGKGSKPGRAEGSTHEAERNAAKQRDSEWSAMNSDMMEALYTIEREKGISVEIMLEALANALVTAYKRMPDAAEEALVEIDIETGDIHVIAQELDEEGQVVKEWDDTPERLRPHRRADREAGDPPAHP